MLIKAGITQASEYLCRGKYITTSFINCFFYIVFNFENVDQKIYAARLKQAGRRLHSRFDF